MCGTYQANYSLHLSLTSQINWGTMRIFPSGKLNYLLVGASKETCFRKPIDNIDAVSCLADPGSLHPCEGLRFRVRELTCSTTSLTSPLPNSRSIVLRTDYANKR